MIDSDLLNLAKEFRNLTTTVQKEFSKRKIPQR